MKMITAAFFTFFFTPPTLGGGFTV
ncbi:pheA operon attenuation leader peptide, PheL [Shewanella baltica OS223]|nr:pheA operon attenuation leader peptide, PheL [Shewanella baltica OS223]